MTSAAQTRFSELKALGYQPAPRPRIPEYLVNQDIRNRANDYWARARAIPIKPSLTMEDEILHSLEVARAHGHGMQFGVPIRLWQPRLSPRYVWT